MAAGEYDQVGPGWFVSTRRQEHPEDRDCFHLITVRGVVTKVVQRDARSITVETDSIGRVFTNIGAFESARFSMPLAQRPFQVGDRVHYYAHSQSQGDGVVVSLLEEQPTIAILVDGKTKRSPGRRELVSEIYVTKLPA